MNKINLLAIMGKSASGKNALQEVLCEIFDTHRVVTTTTRPMREGEVQGIDYNFVTIAEFTQKVLDLEMIEATDFNDWFYGTELGCLHGQKLNVGVFNPSGILALAEEPRINLKVIYVDTDDKIRLQRALNREPNPNCSEICRRFFADEKDFDSETMNEISEMNVSMIKVNNNGNIPLNDIATGVANYIFG